MLRSSHPLFHALEQRNLADATASLNAGADPMAAHPTTGHTPLLMAVESLDDAFDELSHS